MASIKNRRGQNQVKLVTAFVMLISVLYLGTILHHLLAVQQRMRVGIIVSGVNRQAGGGGNLAHHINLI